VGAPPSLPRLALVMTPPALLSHLSALLLHGGLKTLCPSLPRRNDCPYSLCACAGEGADDGPCVHRQHHLPTRRRQDAQLPWLILPAMIRRLLRCKAAYASSSCARTREGTTAPIRCPFTLPCAWLARMPIIRERCQSDWGSARCVNLQQKRGHHPVAPRAGGVHLQTVVRFSSWLFTAAGFTFHVFALPGGCKP
jgi:hypothetical protein